MNFSHVNVLCIVYHIAQCYISLWLTLYNYSCHLNFRRISYVHDFILIQTELIRRRVLNLFRRGWVNVASWWWCRVMFLYKWYGYTIYCTPWILWINSFPEFSEKVVTKYRTKSRIICHIYDIKWMFESFRFNCEKNSTREEKLTSELTLVIFTWRERYQTLIDFFIYSKKIFLSIETDEAVSNRIIVSKFTI